MVQELTESDKLTLAREVAADRAIGCASVYNEQRRRDFMEGWDAAMDHLKEQRDSCPA